MIENAKQYPVSKKKLAELCEGIERLENDISINPLRKEILLNSLIVMRQDIEQEIALYESRIARDIV